MKAVTAVQMREIDRATIQDFNIPGLELMEKAGCALADAAAELLPASGYALVVAGKGNNGGDGFVAARHLLQRGFTAQVALLADAEELTGDAATNCQRAIELDIPIHQKPSDKQLAQLLGEADVVIDAILGTGLSGQVSGRFAEVLGMLAGHDGPIVAADIPSGVNADTGALLGDVPRAEITVTFGLAKQGLYLHPGRGYCGDIRVAEIGLAPPTIENPQLKTYVTELADVAAALPARAPDAHKGDCGRVLVVAGSTGLTGAAAMASLAAARTGAGLVTLAIPAALNTILETKCTEVMTAPLMDHGCGYLRPRNTDEILGLATAAQTVIIGPGLGPQDATAEMVRNLVAQMQCPVVLDADGINAFAGHADLFAGCPGQLVITPHPGELSRLAGMSVGEIQTDRIAAARAWADELESVMVLKGAATVCAAPGGETWINATGNPGMASGGMGDILSGMIGALLAGGTKALPAAYAGVWMHGRAADIAAKQIGPRGYLATDLLQLIPAVYSEIL